MGSVGLQTQISNKNKGPGFKTHTMWPIKSLDSSQLLGSFRHSYLDRVPLAELYQCSFRLVKPESCSWNSMIHEYACIVNFKQYKQCMSASTTRKNWNIKRNCLRLIKALGIENYYYTVYLYLTTFWCNV